MNKKFLSVALFGALLALAPGTFTSCKDYDDDIDSVNERVDETQATLNEKANALQSALDAANREIEAAKTAAANAKTAADKAAADATAAIATAKAAAITEAVNQIKALNYASASDVQSVLSKVTALEAALGNVNIDELATKDQITALQEALDLQEAALDNYLSKADYAADKAKLQAWKEEIEALRGTVATKADLEKLAQEITGFNGNLASLNALYSRLTSIVFAPSFFMNGIEAIPFISLAYTPWDVTNKDLSKWDINRKAKEVLIDNGENSAYYYINPSYIAAENINLKVLSNLAVNLNTRSNNELLTATAVEVKDGKMKVNFKRNTTQPLMNFRQSFVDTCLLIAVQAEVDSTTFITSDWARVFEIATCPLIHNPKAVNDTLHFWSYNDAIVKDTAILLEMAYTETADLDTLVSVCTHPFMMEIDPEAYGLTFEFKAVDYMLQTGDEEETNQAKFIVIDENNVISSCAYNGTPNNRDAIGRQPLIQVVLKDGENVVDVVYFKIKWTEKPVTPTPQKVVDLGALEIDFDATVYDCDSSYVGRVGTEAMNAIYAALNIQNVEFGQVDIEGAFVNADSAKIGSADDELGTLELINGEGESVTYNIEWQVGGLKLDSAAYEAGKVTKTVYGAFEFEGVRYIFNVTIELDVVKPTLNAGYDQPYWNKGAVLAATNADKSFQVNPALTDDENYGNANYETCQIISDMLKGYNLVEDTFVKDANDYAFRFDAARVAELLGKDWKVSEDGQQLIKVVNKKRIVGAEIINGSEIRLFEEDDVATAAAQELLDQKVPVVLVAEPNCMDVEYLVELDHFLVHFIKPLAVDLSNVNDSFKDLITLGDTVYVSTITDVKETFGLKRAIIKAGEVVKDNEALIDWYGIEEVVWDIENAKTNLTEEGGNIVIGSELKSDWADYEAKYKVTPVEEDGKVIALVFKNNSGAHIQQAFQIAIPVYVKTKWTPELKDADKAMVVLTINPGDYETDQK